MKTVNLGGDRLGSGKRMNVSLKSFERSSHDLGYIWRSTMASGTLVPFMNILALPGDTFDIDLSADVKTYPTLGALFGSFKLQLDVFSCPVRLYQGMLHNNKLGIGMNMASIKLPTLTLKTRDINPDLPLPIDIQQINQSSLLAYLGIRGVGNNGNNGICERDFNAIPLIAYWDVYKNYYANKQENIGVMISSQGLTTVITNVYIFRGEDLIFENNPPVNVNIGDVCIIEGIHLDLYNLVVNFSGTPTHLNKVSDLVSNNGSSMKIMFNTNLVDFESISVLPNTIPNGIIRLKTFSLDNIDEMREAILSKSNSTVPFNINDDCNILPYADCIGNVNNTLFSSTKQNGLGLKTYQSDIFNNWLDTDLISGSNGIAEITAIDTSSGSFSIDTLNLSKKVYDMLNRIAVSGGSYDDWLEAVYDHDVYGRTETPVYHGGLSQEVVFQQVISQAEAGESPLGSLAGRGHLADNKKGGKVTVKINEPCVLIGIASLTPRIDYSQGNDWSVDLKTMDDFHKPSLDEIGFQDLLTQNMAFWDVRGQDQAGNWEMYSAGKQPAWINYMTNFNKCYGEFANPDTEMFMTLNRRYEYDRVTKRIKDLTTYIDPVKFNNIFAVEDLSAMNFWVQIGLDITARRKISAKLMPNL